MFVLVVVSFGLNVQLIHNVFFLCFLFAAFIELIHHVLVLLVSFWFECSIDSYCRFCGGSFCFINSIAS